MIKTKKIYISLLFIGFLVSGILFTTNVSAYFNPQVKQSSKGNWMQCYALQYKGGSAYGTAAGGDFTSPTVAIVAATQRLCAYVDGDGNMLTGNIELFSQPSGTGTLPEGAGGKKVYLEVKDNKVSLHQCTTDNAERDCYSDVAKTWEASEGKSFENIAKKINNAANQKYAGYEKMPYNDNGDIGSETQNTSQNITYDDNEGSGGGENSECYENSGALGWILCPLISNVTEALGTIYDGMVEPFLVIEPELLQGNGTYVAWDIFRNFANIAFVILFLAVIFSQLTGVGIDNYGIKRMLPKLIVAAILINLSYVICQLAVDVSNILGNSLDTLFINIAGQVNVNATSPTTFFSSTVNTVGSVLGIGTGIGTILATFSVGLASGFALIIPIFATVISAIIAVIFMFVILFVRKAMAILLVVVAPVAFVAYIMPNTKRAIFDKWLGVFKGILLLYPLAGALIGGGLLASAIIISALGASAASGNAGLQEFFMYIGALLIQVVPFFFLPMLFRRSLTALGNVGERLGRAGTQLGAGAGRRFRENEGMRSLQTHLAAGREGGLRQRIASRRGMRYLGGNGMARNRMRYQKLRSDEGSLGAMFGEDYMLATETANVMKELEASGDINDSGLLKERLQDALIDRDSDTTEGRARIQAYTDALSAKGDSGRDAVKKAYDSAVRTGGVGNVAAKTFADNIMAKHGADYKNNTRSMFEVAKGINEGGVEKASRNAITTKDYLKKSMLDSGGKTITGLDNLAGKVTATTIGNMDDEEFKMVFGSGSVPGGADIEQVAAAAYAALNDQNANIKVDRRAALNKIVDDAIATGRFKRPAQDVHVV